MRIRTANGVGFVRLCVALVIVLVVMSGSAFGQDKRSGRAIKSNIIKNTGVQQRSGMGKTNSKKDAGVTPLPVRKELEATIQTDPVFPVYVEADREPSNPRPPEPPRNLLSDGPGSNGSPFDVPSLPSSGSSGSPSDCITIYRVNQCRCPEVAIPEIRTGVYMLRPLANGDFETDSLCPTPIIYHSSILMPIKS